MKHLLALLIIVGCASADGHSPEPSPEAQPVSTDVDACVRDTSFSVRQTESFYEVTRHTSAAASGGVNTSAQLMYAEGPPPFVVDFGDVLAEVTVEMTVCVH